MEILLKIFRKYFLNVVWTFQKNTLIPTLADETATETQCKPFVKVLTIKKAKQICWKDSCHQMHAAISVNAQIPKAISIHSGWTSW